MGGYHSPSPWEVRELSLTDGSATLIQTHVVPLGEILQLEVNINLYKTSDGSEVASMKEYVSFKNVATVITQLNTQPARPERVRSKGAYAISYDVATASVVKIKVTGENGLYAKSRVLRV